MKIFKILVTAGVALVMLSGCSKEVETSPNSDFSSTTASVSIAGADSTTSEIESVVTTTNSIVTTSSEITTTKKKKKVTTATNIELTTTEYVTTLPPVVIPNESPKPAETEEIPEVEVVVFKPSTHYIHKSTCYWVDSTCYTIENTNDIKARKCSECNPKMEIVNKYTEPKTTTKKTESAPAQIDSYDRQLLAEITWHEYGTCNVSLYEKARIVAGVMNRVNDSRFPNTVYSVLTAPGQFSGYWPGCCTPSQECYDAVDYYFANISSFGRENSWWGDGSYNHFYYQ